MNDGGHHSSFLRELTWGDVFLVLVVLVGCRLLILAVRRIVRHAAESAPSHRRLLILRMAPIASGISGRFRNTARTSCARSSRGHRIAADHEGHRDTRI
jgi:hypothetical protein